MPNLDQIRHAKVVAKRAFGDDPGVEGIGVGDGVLRVYVRDAAVAGRLPQSCEDVDIEFVITDDITARER